MSDAEFETTAAAATVPSSTPPEAKILVARGGVARELIAQLTELAVVIGAFWANAYGNLSENSLLVILGASLVGPGIGKIRGKTPGATITTLAGVGASAGHAVAAKGGAAAKVAAVADVLRRTITVLPLLLLGGCGLLGGLPDTPQGWQRDAAQKRAALDEIVGTAEGLRSTAGVACTGAGEDYGAIRSACRLLEALVPHWEASRATAERVLGIYEDTGRGVDAAQRVIDALKGLVGEFEREYDRAREALEESRRRRAEKSQAIESEGRADP